MTVPARGIGSMHPLWWRVPTWIAIAGTTAASAHGLAARVIVLVLMLVAAAGLQMTHHSWTPVRVAALCAATVFGLASCLLAHNGLGEIPVLVSAGRATDAFDGLALRVFTVVDALAFGGTIGWISRSVAGLLAGIGIPLLVQRALEHRDLVQERDRARALLAEVQAGREAETQAAALRERGRIAREMHDVLAHSLAGLSVQLQAVRAVASRERVGPVVLAPLDKAAALAREGLSEARAVVGTLRDPVGLGLDELPALVERHPGDATLVEAGARRELSADAGHAVYRAVQESLTNAARYAPGSPVRVVLQWRPDVLAVSVTDDGPAPGREAVGGQGSGLGLAGMAERVEQGGGTLRTGPRSDGGWQVVLELPVAGTGLTDADLTDAPVTAP